MRLYKSSLSAPYSRCNFKLFTSPAPSKGGYWVVLLNLCSLFLTSRYYFSTIPVIPTVVEGSLDLVVTG